MEDGKECTQKHRCRFLFAGFTISSISSTISAVTKPHFGICHSDSHNWVAWATFEATVPKKMLPSLFDCFVSVSICDNALIAITCSSETQFMGNVCRVHEPAK